MVMVACGDAFTVAIGAGEGGQDGGGPQQEYGGLYSAPSFCSCPCCPVFIYLLRLCPVLSNSWQRGKCILGAKEPEVDWEGGMRMLDSLGQCSWRRLTLTW